LNVHLNLDHLSNVFQSAYKQFHSIETAPLKVHNDVSLNMDTEKVRAVKLLYLSADFDTIDYSVLLDRLSEWYGTSGTALTWMRSLLIHRFQSIKISNRFKGSSFVLRCSPKTLLLGPCCLPLSSKPQIDHHLYADDTQAYVSLFRADTDLSLTHLGNCLSAISG